MKYATLIVCEIDYWGRVCVFCFEFQLYVKYINIYYYYYYI